MASLNSGDDILHNPSTYSLLVVVTRTAQTLTLLYKISDAFHNRYDHWTNASL